MHECPDCYQACYCSGDIDDALVTTEEWAYEHCVHKCPKSEDEESPNTEEEWREWRDAQQQQAGHDV